MTRYALLFAVALGLLFSSACAGATETQLRDRAVFDFDCPEDQVELHEIDDRTMGVQGCGQRATYVEDCKTCDGSPCDCTWVRDTNGDERDTD